MGRDVALAFCLTLGAGLATTIGAALSFCVPITLVDILPVALSFSAGVMIYVSFVEILGKGLEGFEEFLDVENHENREALAHFYLSLTFFGGIAFGYVLNFVVHKLGYHHNHNHTHQNKKQAKPTTKTKTKTNIKKSKSTNCKKNEEDANKNNNKNKDNVIKKNDVENDKNVQSKQHETEPLQIKETTTEIVSLQNQTTANNSCAALLKDENSSGADESNEEVIALSSAQGMHLPHRLVKTTTSSNSSTSSPKLLGVRQLGDEMSPADSMMNEQDHTNLSSNAQCARSEAQDDHVVIEVEVDALEHKSLIKMSLITALAIALHNFPEGLATFVAALADPSLGFSIAIAIAIHNVPEGISVSMPIYFATKSKWKAFFWSFLSGIAEPIGGFIGYLIIDKMFGDAVFGVLFGLTAGIMIYISFKELLPTARKRDKKDKYSTILVFVGFVVMDASLILFQL